MRGRKNGRSNRIRAYLHRTGKAHTGPEIRKAVDPAAPIERVLWTLADMARRGYVEKIGKGHGCRYRLGPAPQDFRIERRIVPELRPHRAVNGPHVTSLPRRRDHAREQIAADLAAFKARGGRIQKLGITRIFHHPADNGD